jgi:hypothetical protein
MPGCTHSVWEARVDDSALVGLPLVDICRSESRSGFRVALGIGNGSLGVRARRVLNDRREQSMFRI